MDARSVANSILIKFTSEFSRLDDLISTRLSTVSLSNKEKKQVVNLTSGVVRHLSTLDWKISKIYSGNYRKALNKLKTILRLAFFEIDYLDYIPPHATVNEYVSLARKHFDQRTAGVVNGVLRSYLRQRKAFNPQKAFKHNRSRLSVQYAYPEWMIERWIAEWGEAQTEEFCRSCNLRPTFSLRIHPDIISEQSFLDLLKKHHIEYVPSSYFKDVYKITDIQTVRRLGVFEKGFCAIQDESAMMPVQLLQPEQGDYIFDACAAPGGKFTGIMHSVHGSIHLTGLDIFMTRLQMVHTNCQNQKLIGYYLIQGDSCAAPFRPVFDKIIIDAPCSGLGTIQKHPDIKWRRRPDDIEKFHQLQLSILKGVCALLKPGGFMVYSTCTVDRHENEDVIHRFLEQQKNEFSLVEPQKSLDALVQQQYYIKTLPHIHQMDGSFCVKLQRTAS